MLTCQQPAVWGSLGTDQYCKWDQPTNPGELSYIVLGHWSANVSLQAVVAAGAVPLFLELLNSPHQNVCEQVEVTDKWTFKKNANFRPPGCVGAGQHNRRWTPPQGLCHSGLASLCSQPSPFHSLIFSSKFWSTDHWLNSSLVWCSPSWPLSTQRSPYPSSGSCQHTSLQYEWHSHWSSCSGM